MKYLKRLIPVLLAILVLVVPLTVWAQDDGEEKHEFVSEDELLTFSYPAEWVAGETPDLGFPAVATASSEDLLAMLLDPTDEEVPPEPGQAAAQVLLFPLDILNFMGVELTEEMTDEDVAMAFITGLMGDDEDAAMNIGDPEVVEIDEDFEVILFPAVDEEEETEGVVVVYEVADGIMLLGVGQTHIGEYNDDLQALFLEVFTSVEYTGSAEELMLGMMGGAQLGTDFTPTPPAASESGGDTPEFTPTPAS